MPRHLAAGHTHIYSLQSLEWFEKSFRLTEISKWWFGMDSMDLYRSMLYVLNQEGEKYLEHRFADVFLECIDGIQLAMDKNKMCSSVHALYEIQR